MSADYSKRKSLSLLEILIAGIILTLVLVGLLNTFLAGKRWVLHNRLRMTGGELGKYFLDPLQNQVRWDTWNASCLGTGISANCPDTPVVLDRPYTAHYAVSPNTPINNINKVTVDISYPEQ
jgi:hypothetical protein